MIYLGDCLYVMGSIPDGSIDLVLCDLPYGLTACRWDQIIPFEPLWAHYRRLLKPRGAVILTASQPFTTDLIQSNRDWFKYVTVWEKGLGSNFLNTPYQPLKVHEDIVIFSPAASSFSRRGTMTYNPQKGVGRPRKDAPSGGKKGGMEFHQQPKPVGYTSDGDRYPRSVVYIPSVNCAQTERVGHGTQKPVDLMEYLIRTYSNEGETVLDSCMGSGTTGLACLNTGRHFIGIESDPAYFDIAERRLADASNQTPLFAG